MPFFFKIFMAIHIALYKLIKGAMGGHFNNGDVLLLTTTGRKSGKVRTTPLMYIQEGAIILLQEAQAVAPSTQVGTGMRPKAHSPFKFR